jgi:hypothetical protein
MSAIKIIFKIIIKYWYWIYLIADRIYIIFKKGEMKRNGVFTKEQEKFITKVIALKINPKSRLQRWLIRKVLFLIIRAIDNFAFNMIAEYWKLQLIPIVDYGMSGDIENMRRQVSKLLDKKINFNWMDETEEEKWFDALTMLITVSIESYINKKM